MKRLRAALTLLLMAASLLAKAQISASLPKTLFPANGAVLPFMETVYAKFPLQLTVTQDREYCRYYIGIIDTALVHSITDEELAQWKTMLDNMPARDRKVRDEGKGNFSCVLRLNSQHRVDSLAFTLMARYGLFELSYTCMDEPRNEWPQEFNYPETVRLKLDSLVQGLLRKHEADGYDYAVWGKKQVNLTCRYFNNDDNLSAGRHYIVHGCTPADYGHWVTVLDSLTGQDDLSYTTSFAQNKYGFFSVGMVGDDAHWLALCGLLKGRDLHLLQLGGINPGSFELPMDWYTGLDHAGRVDLKDEEGKERVYDASTVNTLPRWRGGGVSWNHYLSQRGLHLCSPSGDDTCVVVMFTVRKDGSIALPHVMLDRGGGPALVDEALSIIKGMPKWTPAMVDGLPVDCRFLVRLTK